jgi:hypothetical protein
MLAVPHHGMHYKSDCIMRNILRVTVSIWCLFECEWCLIDDLVVGVLGHVVRADPHVPALQGRGFLPRTPRQRRSGDTRSVCAASWRRSGG